MLNATKSRQGRRVVFDGATFYPCDGGPPRRNMLVHDGRVVAFDVSSDAPRVDLQGGTVAPGFADSHLHLFALAERALTADCRPARSITDIKFIVAQEAARSEDWVRASSYDDTLLSEQRHLTRADLDDASSTKPIRLVHRTGHLAVVNTEALRRIAPDLLAQGIRRGLVELGEDGEPNGRLWEPGDWFSQAVLPPLTPEELRRGMHAVRSLLLSRGITAVHEASPTNDRDRWEALHEVASVAPVRVLMMPGGRNADQFDPPTTLSQAASLAIGPAKLILPDMPEELPPLEDFTAGIDRLANQGWRVAVHAVIWQAVQLAVMALTHNQGSRVEHAAEWPPECFVPAVAAGLQVTIHPVWLWERAARYRQRVDVAIQPWVHRGRSFLEAGIPIRFASDAPTGEPDPIGALAAATLRRGHDGTVFNHDEAIDLMAAVKAQISGRAALDPNAIDGALTPGAAADFVVLDHDPFAASLESLPELRVRATYIDGEHVWPAE